MEIGTIFIIAIIATIAVLVNIYDSQSAKSTNNSIESFTQKNLENPEKAYKDFCNLVADYGDYMRVNPLSFGEIRNSDILPFSKNTLILYAIQFINILEKNMQKALLQSIPELAYYRDDIPENGYKSNTSKLMGNNELINSNHSEEDKAKEILEKFNEPNDFPNNLYNECEEYSKKLYMVLKKEIDKN